MNIPYILMIPGQSGGTNLPYMVGQILGLFISGLILYFVWEWLFNNRRVKKNSFGKTKYGFIMALWLIFTIFIAFIAYHSPAFALPIIIVIVIGFRKGKYGKKQEDMTEEQV